MVRIKHRYLLLNFLYPSANSSSLQVHGRSTKAHQDPPAYLPFHSPTPNSLTPALLLRHLRASIAFNFGDYGAGVTSPHLKVIYLSNATSTAIVRCPRAHFRLVWAGLTFMDGLPAADGRRGDEARKCVIRVVRVSGTIRKAEEEVVRRARQQIVRAKASTSEGGKLEALMGPSQEFVPDRTDEGGIEDPDEVGDMESDSG